MEPQEKAIELVEKYMMSQLITGPICRGKCPLYTENDCFLFHLLDSIRLGDLFAKFLRPITH